jgi:3-methyl-2-oxobutanoate hydroxymethyltransferase
MCSVILATHGHIGITPMRMPQLGGFVAQGKTAKRAKELVNDARAMVDAGCFSILCEVTTSEVAEYLAETLPVPIISLGAGNRTHGVHIISSDLFHLWEEHVPRHSRIYTDLIPIMEDVISRYMKDVATREYLGRKETVFMNPEEALAFATDMKWERKVEELRSPAVKTA